MERLINSQEPHSYLASARSAILFLRRENEELQERLNIFALFKHLDAFQNGRNDQNAVKGHQATPKIDQQKSSS
jgi:hypothetical protein